MSNSYYIYIIEMLDKKKWRACWEVHDILADAKHGLKEFRWACPDDEFRIMKYKPEKTHL